MLNLLYITIIIAYCIGVSGFIEKISEVIWRWLYPNVKYDGWVIPPPFGCETCMTFWVGLIYVLITGFSWWMLAYVCTLSLLAPVIVKLLQFVKDLLEKILYFIWKLIE